MSGGGTTGAGTGGVGAGSGVGASAQGIPAWGAAARVEEPEGFKEMQFIQAEEKILPTAKESCGNAV